MKLHKQYLMLAEHFRGENSVDVTLDELADIWQCTHRNASHLIAKMSEQGWIRWTGNRGRGQRSTLQLLMDPDEIAKEVVMQAVTKKEILSAFEQIRMHTASAEVRERLEGWMLSHFGYHTEMRNRKQIDVLRLPIRQTLTTLDPLKMNLLAESFVASHIYDTLIRKEDGALKPHLVRDWKVDASRCKWTFYLRKGVFFHHGSELSSEDVVYSLSRLVRTKRRMLYRFVIDHIQEIQAIDRYTVQIILKQQNEWFLPFLSTSRAVILPAEQSHLNISTVQGKPIGTGPFKIAEMNDHLCVLEVFPQYFRERAFLDQVEIYMLPPALVSDAETDDTGLYRVIHNPRALRDVNEDWRQISSEVTVCKFITMNTRKPGPLIDPNMRSAIRSLIMQEHTQTSKPLAFDQPLTIITIPPYERDARIIAKRLLEGGVQVHLQLVSPEQFKGVRRLQSDLLFFSFIRDQDEPLRLFDLFESMAEHAEPHVATDIDQWIQRNLTKTDPQERIRQLKQIEQQFIQDCRMVIWDERPIQTAFHRSVRGVSFHSQGWVDLRQLWFG